MTILTFVGCDKSTLELKYAEQEKRIEQFINSTLSKNNLDENALTRNGGSNRITIVPGEGEALIKGGKIEMLISGYIFNGNISANSLFYTNDEAIAQQAKWDTESNIFGPETFTLNEKDLLKGLVYGLEGVKAGEECIVIFSGKYGFGKHKTGIIPANSALAYIVKVVSIEN